MKNIPKAAILPLAVAHKLAAAASLAEPAFAEQIRQEPRLPELLWFLLSAFAQPGGAGKFALDLIEQFSPQFGPAILHEEGASLTIEQREAIWGKFTQEEHRTLIEDCLWRDKSMRLALGWMGGGDNDTPESKGEKGDLRTALLKIQPGQFGDLFINAAEKGPRRPSALNVRIRLGFAG